MLRPVVEQVVGEARSRTGIAALLEKRPLPGGPVVYKILKTKPEDETQWSVRSMGAETGLSKDAVHRIWRTFGLQPHRPFLCR